MDIKDLIEKLKDDGLDLAEDAAVLVINKTLDWLEEAIKGSSNKYDDLLLAFFPAIRTFLLEAADKIDGEEG